MRRPLLALIPLFLSACDAGLGTGPAELTLDDLSDPPANSAVVLITEDFGDGSGYYDMSARTQYLYTLRTPPPLPELLFDTQIGIGASSLTTVLANIGETGVLVTGSDGVEVRFVAPDGTVFHPLTTCRVTITSPWQDTPGARLQGRSDCPVTDGTLEFRVLFKFDYTVPAA